MDPSGIREGYEDVEILSPLNSTETTQSNRNHAGLPSLPSFKDQARTILLLAEGVQMPRSVENTGQPEVILPPTGNNDPQPPDSIDCALPTVSSLSSGSKGGNRMKGLWKNLIDHLPRAVRQVLMVATCLGSTFDAAILSHVFLSVQGIFQNEGHRQDDKAILVQAENKDHERSRFQALLEIATGSGLLEHSTEMHYKFSHDQCRKSAAACLSKGKIGRMFCLRLGEAILALSHTEVAEDWMLFSAVDLLTQARDNAEHLACTDQGSREIVSNAKSLARVSLEVAQKASQKSAFKSAVHMQRMDSIFWIQIKDGKTTTS